MPDFQGKVVQGGTVGTYKNAGLPNITASAKQTMVGNAGGNGGIVTTYATTGAFTKGAAFTDANSTALSQGYYTLYPLAFDASLSNAIYGNSSTVQPPALCMSIVIKY